jgi:phage terminase small subunit
LLDLTAKEAAFALAYVETGNASEAYRRAFNVRPGTKDKTVWENASRILAKPRVAERVVELQAEARERSLVTVECLTEELEQARLLAMADEKGASAAVAAIMGKAKLHGLLVERREHSGPNGGKFEVEWMPPRSDRDIAKAILLKLAKAKRENAAAEEAEE